MAERSRNPAMHNGLEETTNLFIEKMEERKTG
jgi:hypothetical protein